MGEYNKKYEYNIGASGAAKADLEFVLSAGTPPAGIVLEDNGDRTGQLIGIPEETGDFPLELMVREVENPSNNVVQKFTLDISKAPASVSVNNSTVSYDGNPKSAIAITDPEDLTVQFTYNESPDPPIEVGDYAVTATVNDEFYEGSANGILSIIKNEATITLSDLVKAYNMNPQAPTATTEPPGLEVAFTYDGSPTEPVNANTYALEATIDDPAYEGSTTDTFVIEKAEATVTLSELTKEYTGTAQSPTITTDPPELAVETTYDGVTEKPVKAGSYRVEAIVTDQNYLGTANDIFTINNGIATVTLDDLTTTYTGSPQSPSATTTPAGLDVIFTYDGTSTIPTDAGTYAVEATIDDPDYTGSASGTFIINKAEATVTLSEMTKTYTGDPQEPTATTIPEGLRVDFTYDGSSTPPVSAGNYALTATVNDTNYEGSATGTFTISNNEASITLSDLTTTYTGSPQSPTATTTPAGLDVTFTYDGLSTVPTNAGSYAVVATINDPDYDGSATGTFIIGKAEATVTLSEMTKTYTGEPQEPTATTVPAELTVDFTYDGSMTPPANVGSYAVVATVHDPNYTGTATGTFTIGDNGAAVTLSDMTTTYTGNPQFPTATTVPEGLEVTFTFDGSPTAPTNAGIYAVVATINEPGHTGSASGNFIINKAEATVTLANLTTTHTGEPQSPTATTAPAGLVVDFSYDGLSTPPIDAGSYTVVATINDANYEGSATDTFVINPAVVSITVTDLYQNFDGLPKTVTVTTDPTGLDVATTYDGSSTAPSAQGSYQVLVAMANPNYTGAASETLIINGPPTTSGIPDVTVNEDAAIFQINLKQHFDDVEDQDRQLSFTVQDNTHPSLFNSIEINGSQILRLDFASDKNGTANVTIRGTDTGGLFIEDELTIIINEIQDDPVFASTPVEGVLQGEEYVYKPVATDSDEGDVLTYTKIFAPDWLTFTDQGSGRGLLSGVPGVSDIGNHAVTLEVSDDKGNTATQTFAIQVAESNTEPVFTSTPVLHVDQDQLYGYTITTNDPDGDPVNITAPELPEWLTLTDNGDGRARLEGKAGNDEVGDHTIVLRVSDIFNAHNEQAFTLTVNNINDAPQFKSEPINVASQNGTYIYEITTNDMDEGDTRIIAATTRPDWLSITDNGDGTATLSGDAPEGSAGSKYAVALVVKDRAGASSAQNFILTVNTPPELSDITLLIKEDSPWVLTANDFGLGFSDEDDGSIQGIKIESLPASGSLMLHDKPLTAGTAIKLTAGKIEALKYIPPLNESGSVTFVWTASDGYDWATVPAAVNIEIEPVNDKPILTNIESDPLAYSQKDPGIPVTETIIINDVDHSFMQGATIAIQEGYDSGKDLLTYDNQLNENITGEFDKAEGIMTLTGEDTRSNYEIALSDVLFSSNVLGEPDVIEKIISITVTDGFDSSDALSRRVRIADLLPELDIVSAFTPNNDAVNDLWDFVNLEFYSAIRINVFNQSGSRVFSCSSNDCTWDGSLNGKQLPAGPYFYTIDLNDGKKTYRGTVTILK